MGGGQSRPQPKGRGKGKGPVAPSKPKGIIVYQNCDKKGLSRVLNEGKYDITKLGSLTAIPELNYIQQIPGVFPPDISYITVPKGFTATIYTGSFAGQQKTLVGPEEFNFCSEGWWANDKIRSIIITNTDASASAPAPAPTPTPSVPSTCPPEKPCPPPPPPAVDPRIFTILDKNHIFDIKGVPIVCKDILKAARTSGSLDNFLNIYNLTNSKSITQLSDFVGALSSPTVDQTLAVDSVSGYSNLDAYLNQMETSQIPIIRNVSNCMQEATSQDSEVLIKAKERYETSKERYELITNEDHRVSYYEGWFPISRPLTLTTLYVLFAVGLFFIIISVLLFLSMQGVELKFILPAFATASATGDITAYGRYGPVAVGGCIVGAAGVAIYLWAKQFYTKV
jgi:hypothetical protein